MRWFVSITLALSLLLQACFLGRLPLGIETSFVGGSATHWRFLRGPDVSGTLEGAGGARGVLAVLKDASSWKAVAADTLGNVLALAGVNGDFTRRTFDPWGNPLTRDSAGNLRASTLQERRTDYDALPLAWASQEYDPDTGLTHYHFREYSPSLGGWLATDPIGLAGGYLNLRSYLGNMPSDALDVWGAEPLTVTAVLAASAAPAIAGALVAVTIQGAVDLYHGELSNAEVYYSVAVGGATAGVVGRWTGNPFLTGAAYGGATNLTKQLLDEKRQSIHWDEVAADVAFGAVLGKVGEKLAPVMIAGGRKVGALLPSEFAAQISAQLSKLESSVAKAFAKRNAGQVVKSPCPVVSQTIHPLRQQYIEEVLALEELGLSARAAGADAEAVARMLVAERNALKVKYRELSPADFVKQAEARNVEKYGNPLGPTADQLRAQGKTWEQIIDSAARPDGKDLGL